MDWSIPHPWTCPAGVYEIFGFFRFIEDLTVFNLPKDEPKPSLPEGNFKMDIMVSAVIAAPRLPDDRQDTCVYLAYKQ